MVSRATVTILANGQPLAYMSCSTRAARKTAGRRVWCGVTSGVEVHVLGKWRACYRDDFRRLFTHLHGKIAYVELCAPQHDEQMFHRVAHQNAGLMTSH